MKLSFVDGIYFVLIFFFLLTGILLLIKSKQKISNFFLGAILVLCGYATFCRFLDISGLIITLPHFIETDFVLFFLTPALFLFYVKSHVFKESISRKAVLIKSIPFFCSLIFLLPVFFMNTSEKINYIKTESVSSLSWRYLVLNTSFFIYSVSFLFYTLFLLRRYTRTLNEIPDKTKKEIGWIKAISISLLLIQGIALVLLFSPEEKKFNYLPGLLIIMLAILIIKWVLNAEALKTENGKQNGNKNPAPVSYTHLTLPTNREV